MKTSIGYIAACVLLEIGVVLLGWSIYDKDWSVMEKAALFTAPGLLALVLTGLGLCIDELQRRKTERDLIEERLKTIRFALVEAKKARKRAYWASWGCGVQDPETLHEREMVEAVNKLEYDLLKAIRDEN